MTNQATELLNKHLGDSLTIADADVYMAVIAAISEALTHKYEKFGFRRSATKLKKSACGSF